MLSVGVVEGIETVFQVMRQDRNGTCLQIDDGAFFGISAVVRTHCPLLVAVCLSMPSSWAWRALSLSGGTLRFHQASNQNLCALYCVEGY